MPLTLTTPEVQPSVTTFRIESFSVQQINDPSNGPLVSVELSRGAVVAGVYQPFEIGILVKLDLPATIARMGVVVPPGTTLYDAIKSALYELLLADGHVGAGTVT